jgi:hypothetical protein
MGTLKHKKASKRSKASGLGEDTKRLMMLLFLAFFGPPLLLVIIPLVGSAIGAVFGATHPKDTVKLLVA